MKPPVENIGGISCYVQDFRSISELTEALIDSVAYEPHGDYLGGSHIYWIGREFANWKEVVAATKTPWTEGVEIMERMLAELDDCDLPVPHDRRRVRRWSEEDGEMDVERLMSNDPFCYEDRVRAVREGPTHITIAVTAAASAYVKSDLLMWRGAAALCLSDRLETAGWSTRIIVCDLDSDVYDDGKGMFISVPIKDFGESLSIPQCAAFVSGWFRRGVILKLADHRLLPRVTASIGSPENLSKAKSYIETPNEKLRVIDGIWCFDEAVEYVRETINQLNSNLERTHHA